MESPCWVVKSYTGLAGVQHMCGTSNPQSPASRAVAAFQRLLTLWPQSSSSAAYASTGRYRLKRGAPWCHQQSLSQRQPVLTAPPLRPSPAAQVSLGHFVVGVVFGLLGSGGETLTAGWPIVSCAGAESSEWMALALLVSVSIDRVGQICTGHWAAGPGRGMLHPQ